MGIAVRLASDGPQSETAGLVIAGAFQASVIDHQHLGVAHLEEQFAIIRPGKRIAHDGFGAIPVERRVGEKDLISLRKVVHHILGQRGVVVIKTTLENGTSRDRIQACCPVRGGRFTNRPEKAQKSGTGCRTGLSNWQISV